MNESIQASHQTPEEAEEDLEEECSVCMEEFEHEQRQTKKEKAKQDRRNRKIQAEIEEEQA